MPHVDLDGRAVEYDFVRGGAAGSPVMVFLHEGLGSLALWKDFPHKMAAASGCGALVYSRYGYGTSAPLLRPREPSFMHEEALSLLPRLLDRLDIEDPILFGHSDGASIALIHAASGARAVRSLILMAPHVMVEDMCIRSIAAARQTFETTDLRRRLARYHADPDAAFWGWCNIWLDPRFRDWNIENEVKQVHCPVLAIQGFDDEYGTMQQIDRIAELATDVELLKLQACGHSPHRDQPDAVIAAASRHVASLEARDLAALDARGRTLQTP
jgi:pimeloyl-ACP methyl ester carboxylesterase